LKSEEIIKVILNLNKGDKKCFSKNKNKNKIHSAVVITTYIVVVLQRKLKTLSTKHIKYTNFSSFLFISFTSHDSSLQISRRAQLVFLPFTWLNCRRFRFRRHPRRSPLCSHLCSRSCRRHPLRLSPSPTSFFNPKRFSSCTSSCCQ